MTQCNREVSFRPNLSPEQTEQNLSTLLVCGTIRNPALDSSIEHLEERFRSYCSYYRHGLWAPGLIITNEMRANTEQYLAVAEIRRSFRHFFSGALRYPLSTESNPFQNAASWLDLLQQLRLTEDSVNPANLLRKLSTDESSRIRFLFNTLLPHHHGGSFCRYPDQLHFLKEWITQRRNLLCNEVRCLDAACGTGEGTYDLVDLLIKSDIPSRARKVHGSSLEPLEVFAAAHGYFPHDRDRQARFRSATEPLFDAHAADSMLFFRDTITRLPTQDEKPYDVILCNGLLGGPFLHGREALETAVTALTQKLKTGGIFLAADRFHGGWKKKNPTGLLEDILVRSGLSLCHIEEGVAAEKSKDK